MPILVENTPEAGSLVGSMRSMGYTFESAVADILKVRELWTLTMWILLFIAGIVVC